MTPIVRRILPLALAATTGVTAGCNGVAPPGIASGQPDVGMGEAASRAAFAAPPGATDLDPAPDAVTYELTAAPGRVPLGTGQAVEAYVYNGSYPGPTLDVREGDRVVVRFKNALPEATSLHWHGVSVPADQDDALESIAPGATREFRFTVPRGSAGAYWYHPHMHGTVAKQVDMGLFGTLRVRAADDPLPAALGDDVAVLSDPRIGSDARIMGPAGTMEMAMGVEGTPLVNGRSRPRLVLQPGEARRMRFVNASSARYYQLQLGSRSFTLVGTDGGLIERPTAVQAWLLAPGERAEFILPAPERAGETLALQAMPYDRGAMGGMAMGGMPASGAGHAMSGHAMRYGLAQAGAMPAMGGMAETLLELAASGTPAAAPALPATLRAIPQLATGGATTRTFTITENHATADFRINGLAFDPARVDVTTRLGATEVWQLDNKGDMDHPFHLHGFAFQVLDRGGRPEALRAWKDTVNLRRGEVTRLAVKFDGFPGLRVYHCHILEHEDRGMMGVLKVE